MDGSQVKRFAVTLAFTAIILSIMVFIPMGLGYGRGGFSIKQLYDQFLFYIVVGGVSATVILCLTGYEFLTRKNDIIYGNGLGFNSPGETPHLRTKLFQNPIRLALGCFIIFGILGLIAGVSEQTYFGVGSFQQQFTKFDGLVFSSALIATSENLGAGAILCLIIFFLRNYARKNNLGKKNFVVMSYVFGIVGVALFGVVNHLLRYGANDMNIVNVAVIWAMGGFITVLTGSFIPFWVLHITNNIFYSLGKLFSNDGIVIGTIVGLVALSALYTWLYLMKKPSGESDG